ncbi:MAG: family 10 glycosylhydrolase [Planctomycetales bacterium]|nr:family 10 glycosylhydrolase [Planctomycetales bacterium]
MKVHGSRSTVLGCALMLAAACGGATPAQEAPRPAPPAEPRPEVRAVWVTRWDTATAADVREAIRNVRALRCNVALFQVRGAADAFYRSDLEPWAEELGGEDPGYDPLAVACDEAHAAGVALHAYMNTMPAWRGTRPPRSPRHLWNAHRDWIAWGKDGKTQALSDKDYVVLNPSHPEARRHLVAVYRDVARRYPVAGIHLDYVRYLSPGFSYDPVSLGRFRAETGKEPGEAPEAWARWRRDVLTSLVGEIAAACRAARPGVLVSAAVWRNPRRGRDDVLQDWPAWLEEGLLDWAFPMIYTKDEKAFRDDLLQCRAAVSRGLLLPGLGAYQHEADPALTLAQIAAAREAGFPGFSLFAYGTFFPSAQSNLPPGKRAPREKQEAETAPRRAALLAGALREAATVPR